MKTIFNPCDLCDNRDTKECQESCVQLSHFLHASQFKVGEEVIKETAWNAWVHISYPLLAELEEINQTVSHAKNRIAFESWYDDFKSTHPELFGNIEQVKKEGE